jgi:DNA-binding LacI/PurR family transcriptional regulator
MVDVARRAGVSQKTVSRVVNNAPHVRPDVVAKVNQAIEDLGYRPNVAARALASQRTHTIGVLAAGTPLHGPTRRVFSLEQAARRRGYALALTTLPDVSAVSVADGIESLLARGIEGLVIEVPSHLVEVNTAQVGDLPVVTSAGRIAGLQRQCVVDIDQADVSRRLTEHLLQLGHDTVWHLGGPRDWDAAEKRMAGWRTALVDAGRPVPEVLFGDWSARSGFELGRALADRDEVTAVFAANDHMAMGLLRAFFEAGRSIPAEVSIAGWDDVPEAEFQMVPLTTVATDAETTADLLLSELVSMIEGGDPADIIDIGAELVIRSSTGPPDRKTSQPVNP